MCPGRVCAAISVAAAFLVGCVCGCGPARADDDLATFLLFSGTDIWRDGRFAHFGVMWSPDGVVREGFTLQLLASGGVYRYRSGAFNDNWVFGLADNYQIMPGWRFQGDRYEVKVFGGLDVTSSITFPGDPDNRLRGRRFGPRTTVNVWYEPAPHMVIAVDGSLSAIYATHALRLAYGLQINDTFYVGPEVQEFGMIGYAQWRLGAHVTGLRFDEYEWSAAAGLARDSGRSTGFYARVGLAMRR